MSWGFSPTTRERGAIRRLDYRTHPDYDRSVHRHLGHILPRSAFPSSAYDRLLYQLAIEFDNLPAIVDTLHRPSDDDRTVYDATLGLSYTKPIVRHVRSALDERPVIDLVAVGCSAAKRDTTVPARDLYDSAYWTCKRRCGEQAAADWRIVSAEHGLLDPARVTSPYERTVGDLRGVPVDHPGELPNGEPVTTMLDEWALRVHEGLNQWVRSAVGTSIVPRDVQLVVLLGQSYEQPLVERDVFDLGGEVSSTVAVRFPWREADLSGIGEQMSWLNAEAGVAGGESA